MNNIRTAAQALLDAYEVYRDRDDIDALDNAVNTLRAALAEPEPLAKPAPEPRKPLTDEQLWSNDQIMSLNADIGWHMDTIRMFARAIEAAHGITGDAQKAPQPTEWQELTDEEMWSVYDDHYADVPNYNEVTLYRSISAALKAKNGGGQ